MKQKLETPPVPQRAPAAGEASPTILALEMHWNALQGQQALLREEIKRGNEYLARAQSELAESRSQLEEWPTYERRCGGNCLPRLTESVQANRRVARFLAVWLRRRQDQLAAVSEAVDRLASENTLGQR